MKCDFKRNDNQSQTAWGVLKAAFSLSKSEIPVWVDNNHICPGRCIHPFAPVSDGKSFCHHVLWCECLHVCISYLPQGNPQLEALADHTRRVSEAVALQSGSQTAMAVISRIPSPLVRAVLRFPQTLCTFCTGSTSAVVLLSYRCCGEPCSSSRTSLFTLACCSYRCHLQLGAVSCFQRIRAVDPWSREWGKRFVAGVVS